MTDCCLASTAASKAIRSFFLLGLLNNAPWVLMLACATNISAGGVALVFLSNQIPGLIVKITAPYWFHAISYKTRILMASFTMGTACFLVGCGGLFRDEMAEDGGADDIQNQAPENADRLRWGLTLELLGVSFVSFSCSLGEASLLALAGKFDSVILPRLASTDSYWAISENQAEDSGYNASQQNDPENLFTEEYELSGDGDDTDETESEEKVGKLMKQGTVQQRKSITAFSSGTGLAGIVGYGYKALFSELLGWGLSSTLWSAILFAFAYWVIYLKGLYALEVSMQQDTSEQSNVGIDGAAHPTVASESSLLVKSENEVSGNSSVRNYRQNNNKDGNTSALEMVHTDAVQSDVVQRSETISSTDSTDASSDLTSFERFKLVLSFWPYTIPLFTVYAAEYMLQAGVWSAIGFPVTSASARAQFYHYSNWTYQAGVFLSRSSGNMWTASVRILWLMPFLQVVNLYFFWMNSIHHFWYNYSLLLPCFFAGLLGGGVYVQGFSRVNMDMPLHLREFAIASVGVADSLGILIADVLSLFIQSCIYKQNNLGGAVVNCPY